MATEAGTETVGSIDEWTKPPFLRRVRIRGYKSIAFCDVPLQPLTILVGKNAAGKSNFLDALAFLRDVMALGVAEAVKLRGGWSAIACRTSDAQPIELEVEAGFTCGRPYPRAGRNGAVGANSPDQEGQVFSARYNLKLSVDASSIPIIERETLDIADAANQPVAGFEMHGGIVQRWKSKTDSGSAEVFPHSSGLISLIRPDHPLLAVIGTQPSTDLWAGLRYMAFYNFNPDTLRRPQPPLPGVLLDRDGWNIASVIASLRDREPNAVERVREYLALVTEEVRDFEVVPIGGYETLRFEVQGGEGTTALAFDARSMSDGTLRTLASLMAVFQRHLETGPTVVGIEEPETALHPESVRVLVDALEDATQRTQILLTTHSPDLLAGRDLTPGHVLVVRKRDGQTQIGPVDAASREIIRKELYTLAELQRMDHLEPDAADLMRQTHAMTAAEE
jgi:predicted ATPase